MAKRGSLFENWNCVDRARAVLEELVETRTYDKGSLLFEQGSLPCSVFFLRSGSIHLERADVEVNSDLCVARPGDVIGVSFAVSGRSYDMSAVATKQSQVDLVERDAFLSAMIESPGLHLEVVRMLSIDLGRCYEVLRTLGPKTRNRRAKEGTL